MCVQVDKSGGNANAKEVCLCVSRCGLEFSLGYNHDHDLAPLGILCSHHRIRMELLSEERRARPLQATQSWAAAYSLVSDTAGLCGLGLKIGTSLLSF